MHGSRRKRLGLTAVSIALATMVAACGGGGGGSDSKASDGKPQTGGIATVDWVANPTNLDPLKYNVLGSYNVYSLVYSTLFRWEEDSSLKPELASEDPVVSEDGLTYTIKLRDGVKWHDGSAFSSKDVAHTINAVLDPKNGSTWYASLSPITKVETPDAMTVTLTLDRPHSVLQGMLAQIPIISASKPYVVNKTWANTMMGTGPFKFARWDQGSQVVLERNDDYFVKGLPYLDGVVMKTVTEDAARIANIAGGQSDVMPMVPFNQIESLKSRGVNVVTTKKSALLPTIFPSQKAERPTSKPEFRRAIAWAIDRGQIADVVFQGAAEPASTLLSDGTANWNKELGTTYGDKADLGEAKAALKASGVATGTPIELVVRNEPTAIAIGTVVQANLKTLGLKATLSPEESASYLPKLFAGDFDLMMLDIEVGITSGFTPMYAFAATHSTSGSNYLGFKDAEMDRLLEEALSDPEDPAAAWTAVQKRDLEILPYIPTVTARYVEAYSDRLKGHTPSSLFSLRDLDSSWIAE